MVLNRPKTTTPTDLATSLPVIEQYEDDYGKAGLAGVLGCIKAGPAGANDDEIDTVSH